MKIYKIKPLDNLTKTELAILDTKLNFHFLVKKLYAHYGVSTFKELAKIIGVSTNLEYILNKDSILKDKCKELDLYNHIFSFTEIANFRKNIKIVDEKDKLRAIKNSNANKVFKDNEDRKDLLGLKAKQIKKDTKRFKEDIANNKEEAFKILEKIIEATEGLIKNKELSKIQTNSEYEKAKKRINTFFANNILYLDQYQEKEIRLWMKRLSLKRKHTSLKDYKTKAIKVNIPLAKKNELREQKEIQDRINERKEKEYILNNDFDDTFTFIKANIDEFSSESSRNSISNLCMNNIRIPLPNATIYFYLENKIHSTLYFKTINNQIEFLLNQEKTISLDITNIKKSIDSQLNQKSLENEERNLILDSLAVLQFMAFYEKDQEKIQNEKREQFIKDIKESALKAKPNENNLHHVIKINTLGSQSNHIRIGTRRESDGKWLVCGHMRHQRYKNEIKLIWIAPHWRGHGNKKISKTYKIEKGKVND